jgi:hypothetical protein
MSIQEVGTMVKTGVCPYLFVINNDGWVPVVHSSLHSLLSSVSFFAARLRHFACLLLHPPSPMLARFLRSLIRSLRSAPLDSYEIERQIHGVKAKYNDIQMLDHQMMLPFFVGRKTVRFLLGYAMDRLSNPLMIPFPPLSFLFAVYTVSRAPGHSSPPARFSLDRLASLAENPARILRSPYPGRTGRVAQRPGIQRPRPNPIDRDLYAEVGSSVGFSFPSPRLCVAPFLGLIP